MNVLSALKPNYPYVAVSHAQMGVLNLATSLLKANEEKCGLKVLAGLNFQTVNHGNFGAPKNTYTFTT